jgi:general secretion pathway protein G
MNRWRRLVGRAGFTLVELLVVIVVLGALAAIVVPRFLGAGERSREAALKSDLRILRGAVTIFENDCKAFPHYLSDLAVTKAPASGLDRDGKTKAINAADWNGPYVEEVPNDPISGKAFIYIIESPNVGKVKSSATGTARDGTKYEDW